MSYDRQKYLDAVKSSVENNIFYHSLALEACLGGIYDYLAAGNLLKPNDPPRDDWLLAGLVHDIDYGGEFKDQHPFKTKEALAKFGLEISDTVHQIVQSHDARQNLSYQNQAQWAILCADSLTGLIIATALVYPTKKLADVKTSSVIKRFHQEPRFAAGTRRDEVAKCELPEGLNLPVDKFIEICLISMQKIASEINL